MEESMYLSGLCKSVTLIHRREEFRASKAMQDRVLKNAKIKIHYNSVVDEVLDVSKGEVTGARIKNIKTDETSIVATAGFFVAIGHTPNTDLFAGQLDLHDNGYIRTRPGSTYTSTSPASSRAATSGLRDSQAVTAAGTGCMAALDAERWMAIRPSLGSPTSGLGLRAPVVRSPRTVNASRRSPHEQPMTEREDQLARVPFFDGLTPEALKLIALATTEESHATGTKLFQYGDPGDKLFIILEGRVRISREVAGVGEEALAVLGPGEVFGEMSLLDEAPRSADARTSTSVAGCWSSPRRGSTTFSTCTRTWPTRSCGTASASCRPAFAETGGELTFLTTSGEVLMRPGPSLNVLLAFAMMSAAACGGAGASISPGQTGTPSTSASVAGGPAPSGAGTATATAAPTSATTAVPTRTTAAPTAVEMRPRWPPLWSPISRHGNRRQRPASPSRAQARRSAA